MKRGDVIELSVPARPECLLVVRLTMAAVAERMGFTLDQLEDGKVAVAESCLWLMDRAKPAQLNLRLLPQGERLAVAVSTRQPGEGEGAGPEMGEHSLLLVHAMADDVKEVRDDAGLLTAMEFTLPLEG